MPDFSGIFPALVTPLTATGELDIPTLERLTTHLYQSGVHGLYLCGSTGEGRDLPPATREQILEIVLRLTPPGRTVIAHIGATRLEETLRLARHAESAGASAISSLPPGPQFNFAEIRSWYEQIGQSTALPLILYHFPSLGVPFNASQLEDLLTLPHVAGLKFTSFDLYTLRELTRQGHLVFNGHDEVLAPGLLMGACGGIGSTYNLMPAWFLSLHQSARAQDWPTALTFQDQINSVIRVLLDFPFLPALKQVLTWQGYPCGPAVAPRAPLTAEQQSQLRHRLTGLLF